jgi:hypothetical protein
MPIDLICYQRDSLEVRMRRRFDARNNIPRIGRVLIARGRVAADGAISSTFGPNTLVSFKVWTNEVNEGGNRHSFLIKILLAYAFIPRQKPNPQTSLYIA